MNHDFTLEGIAQQTGRTALVTGANIGIGFETAKALASKGMEVLLACRDEGKARAAASRISEQIDGVKLHIVALDLSDLDSVRACVERVSREQERLDVLINNAGVMVPPLMRTKQGFELQMGVNHLGHFALTCGLMPLLEQGEDARVISLSSIAHKRGKIDFDNLNAERSYSKVGAYAQSKLACLMFAYELQRRLQARGSKVISVAAHPGVSPTNLGQHLPSFVRNQLSSMFEWAMNSPKQAALPSVMAALVPGLEGGSYIGPQGFREMKGKPGLVDSTARSKDLQVAKRLWEVSQSLVGESFWSTS